MSEEIPEQIAEHNPTQEELDSYENSAFARPRIKGRYRSSNELDDRTEDYE